MGRATVSFDFYPEGEEGPTVELEVRGSFSAYIPAKVSGPPENCYPAEGGELEDMQVFRIFPTSKKGVYREEEISPDVLYQLLVDDEERPPKTVSEAESYVDDELYNNVEEDEPDYPEPDDDYYDDPRDDYIYEGY